MTQTRPKHWTEEQIRILRTEFYKLSDAELALKIGRTQHAIMQKRKDLGLSRLTSTLEGGFLLPEVAKEIGYSNVQIRRARGYLGQKWRRLPGSYDPRGKKTAKGDRYLITPEQVDELLAYFKAWGPRGLKACAKCNRTQYRHKARGFCEPCYSYQQKLVRTGRPNRFHEALVLVPSKVKFGKSPHVEAAAEATPCQQTGT
jgi:hypothetical protein